LLFDLGSLDFDFLSHPSSQTINKITLVLLKLQPLTTWPTQLHSQTRHCLEKITKTVQLQYIKILSTF